MITPLSIPRRLTDGVSGPALAMLLTSLASLSGPGALADEPIPNLEGTWIKTDGQIIYWNYEINTFPHDYDIAQIQITDQEGAVFRAYQSSIAGSDAHSGRHGTDVIAQDALPMVGVVAWDGRSVTFSDIGDTTVQQCTLVDPDTMHCIVWEASEHAIAGRVLLEREQD